MIQPIINPSDRPHQIDIFEELKDDGHESWTVSVSDGEWDPSTFDTEQEAIDEAEAIQGETGYSICKW